MKFFLCMASVAAVAFGINPVAAAIDPMPVVTSNPVVIEKKIDDRPGMIDLFFHARHMPLEGMGAKMVEAADAYNLDWRLLPALSVRESSGGIHECGFNPFGWASCAVTFESYGDAINTVAKALGNGSAYRGKTLRQKLQTYNPPSIVYAYADEVIAIMGMVGH